MAIDIASLIVAAGGQIVGKIRLQKILYLLDQMGLDSGFAYEYHHYGPYSEELAERVEDDVIFGHVEADRRRRQSDGVPYVIYRATKAANGDPIDSNIPADEIRNALVAMQARSATVLELAATIHWLAEMEGYPDWSAELIRRKGAKTQNGRAEQAFDLLRSLALPPAAGDDANKGAVSCN